MKQWQQPLKMESTEKMIPGEGTYAISPDGTVTFTPEANFVGKGTGVTIVRKDKNGTQLL